MPRRDPKPRILPPAPLHRTRSPKLRLSGYPPLKLSGREDVVLIASHDGILILYTLRYPNEVRAAKDVPGVGVNGVPCRNAVSIPGNCRTCDTVAR
jgi:hypothetical protein